MKFKFSLINDVSTLMLHKDSILGLFQNCFGKGLDPVLWEWAYCNNPSGSPIVSLCHVDEKLVGHYAFIPFNLSQGENILPSCLSMTTMVDASCRKYGLFVEQAQQVSERARELGFGIVFGFPNAKAAPGLRKRLGWVLDEPDFVASITLKQLSDSPAFRASLEDSSLVKFAVNDRLFMEWRLSKPRCVYRNINSIIIKEFGTQDDIVAITNLSNEDHIDNKHYNILLDATVSDLRGYEVFPYQFGYKVLDSQYSGLKFKKDMLMSDVF
jgi:hypothetical protein